MNKEFKSLADEAGFVRFSPEEDSDTPIDWSCDYTEDLNRFAELIVRQCAMIADTERSNSVGCGYITKTLGMRIKEHFGV